MNYQQHLLDNKEAFFKFMKETYHIFQFSNIFLRDIQYALISYFKLKGFIIKYANAEQIAIDFANELTRTNELIIINDKSWKIMFSVGVKKEIPQEEGVENE
jgi:hypothetical protein